MFIRSKVIRVAAVAVAAASVSGLPAFEAHAGAPYAVGDRLMTYANPVDLPYRFQPSKIPYREGADPTVAEFRGSYYLFVSHSKGYWSSKDLKNWKFIEPVGYQVGRFAPTVMVMHDKMYLAASEGAPSIWVTDDPALGQWSVAANVGKGYDDPDLFLDDDGKVYMYHGLSGTDVLHVAQLDATTLQPVAHADIPASRDKTHRGYEIVGDQNERESAPSYVEGSWVNKIGGKYYLQYATPGTEFKTYADGLLVADKPMGPFKLSTLTPMSVKPTGFISGAGHSSTFQGPSGNWWHVSTMSISMRHIFERRLGLFPVTLTDAGPVADTYLGDYPHYLNGNRSLTGWMLLSRKKAVTASSSLANFPAGNAVDEEVRTWWSAQTGNEGEWFQVDLGGRKKIQAVQINFADQDSTGKGISQEVYNYVLKTSTDGKKWRIVADHSKVGRDSPHDYEVLAKPALARYVRIENHHSPDNSKFSLFDLRVFGNGKMPRPAPVIEQSAARDISDPRSATFTWSSTARAEFYIVRFGTDPKTMNQSYQVYDGETSISVHSLVAGSSYFYSVDAVNEGGIQPGVTISKMQ